MVFIYEHGLISYIMKSAMKMQKGLEGLSCKSKLDFDTSWEYWSFYNKVKVSAPIDKYNVT